MDGDVNDRLAPPVSNDDFQTAQALPNPVRLGGFVNLPARATIRIYTVGGLLVDLINHNDPSGGGQATWDLRNRSDQFVASGVYFFHVSTPEGDEHVGKFTVVNFAN